MPIHLIIPEPNTWKEIVEAVAARKERRIAIQEYGRSNPEMNAALERLGATVSSIVLYKWDLPDDLTPLQKAARRIADDEADVVLFTSSIQLDHLLQVAEGLGIRAKVESALAAHPMIASVGPVMTASLEARGFRASIIPKHPKMASLVKAAAEFAAERGPLR